MFFKTQVGRGSKLQDLVGEALMILPTCPHVVGVKLWREVLGCGGTRAGVVVSTVSCGIEFRSDVVDPTDKKRTKAVGQLLSTVVRR